VRRPRLGDLADEIAETDTADTLKQRFDKIAATMACHGSVRSAGSFGRKK
jgi:DNA mismatch repair ATPase MutL